MAYRLSTGDQPVSRQIQTILLSEIDSAMAHLQTATPADREHCVHEARKNFKKIRALLRLIAPRLPRRSFRRENHRMRDIARHISAIRDAEAILESFRHLPEETLSPTARASTERWLQSQKAATYKTLDVETLLQNVVLALRDARTHLVLLATPEDGYSTVEPGLVETYRQGRKLLRAALADPSPDILHSFRKRVKDHWYHMRLLDHPSLPLIKDRALALREVEMLLGESHNLHVLRHTLACRRLSAKTVAALKAREVEMGVQALAQGAKLYEGKPRRLRDALAGLHEKFKRPLRDSHLVPRRETALEDRNSEEENPAELVSVRGLDVANP